MSRILHWQYVELQNISKSNEINPKRLIEIKRNWLSFARLKLTKFHGVSIIFFSEKENSHYENVLSVTPKMFKAPSVKPEGLNSATVILLQIEIG